MKALIEAEEARHRFFTPKGNLHINPDLTGSGERKTQIWDLHHFQLRQLSQTERGRALNARTGTAE